MSRSFAIPTSVSSEDSSGSEESLDLVEPPFADLTQPNGFEIEDDDEGELDYEGRDSYQQNDFRPSIHKNPMSMLSNDISFVDNIRFFQQQPGLLEQVTPHKPKSSLTARNFRQEETESTSSSFDEDVDIDEDYHEAENRSFSSGFNYEEPEKSLEEAQELEIVPIERPVFQHKEIALEGFPNNYQFRRSFRVGWGPDGTLIVPRNSLVVKEKAKKKEGENSVSTVTISKVQIFENKNSTFQPQTLTETKKTNDFRNEIFLLENHLEHSKMEQGYGEISHFRVSNPDQLIKINRKGSPNSSRNYQIESEIWYLVEMLWGEANIKEVNESELDRVKNLYRRLSVSRWLRDTTSEMVDEEILKIQEQQTSLEEKECAAIFQYLSTRKISEAVDCAIKNKDHTFAALVCQAASLDTPFKINMQKQVQQWKNNNTFSAIRTHRQHIYHILSGEIEDSAKNLDWKRGFGLYLWYGRDTSEAAAKLDLANQLSLALSLYENAFKGSKAQFPKPQYSLKKNSDQEPTYLDTSYHLLRLFCHPDNHPLRTVLQPSNHSQYPLNYHVSWHLYRILRIVMRDSIDVQGYEQFNYLDYQVSMNYAHQLELLGHWEWAIYVVLNIYSANESENQPLLDIGSESRQFDSIRFDHRIGARSKLIESTVKEIISRHTPDLYENPHKRNFLINKLHVPETWIKSLEAIFEHYKGNYDNELQLLLESQQWELAHTILMKIISELVLYNKTDILYDYLDVLSQNRNSLKQWPSRGGLFYEYLQLTNEMEISTEKESSKLLQNLTSLLSRIQQWNNNNSLNTDSKLIQQGCVDKISTHIHSCITHLGVRTVDQSELKSLPNDYLKHHLDLLTNRFLKNISK